MIFSLAFFLCTKLFLKMRHTFFDLLLSTVKIYETLLRGCLLNVFKNNLLDVTLRYIPNLQTILKFYMLQTLSKTTVICRMPQFSTKPFHLTDFFLFSLKTSEHLWISYVFRGYKKRPVTKIGLLNLLTAPMFRLHWLIPHKIQKFHLISLSQNLWTPTVSAKFQTISPKLCGNFAYVFCKNDILKYFAKITGKPMCYNLLLINV